MARSWHRSRERCQDLASHGTIGRVLCQIRIAVDPPDRPDQARSDPVTPGRTGAGSTAPTAPRRQHGADSSALPCSSYIRPLATMTSGNDTMDARLVTIVRVFKVPLVDRPSKPLNIQKKLLLT